MEILQLNYFAIYIIMESLDCFSTDTTCQVKISFIYFRRDIELQYMEGELQQHKVQDR